MQRASEIKTWLWGFSVGCWFILGLFFFLYFWWVLVLCFFSPVKAEVPVRKKIKNLKKAENSKWSNDHRQVQLWESTGKVALKANLLRPGIASDGLIESFITFLLVSDDTIWIMNQEGGFLEGILISIIMLINIICSSLNMNLIGLLGIKSPKLQNWGWPLLGAWGLYCSKGLGSRSRIPCLHQYIKYLSVHNYSITIIILKKQRLSELFFYCQNT